MSASAFPTESRGDYSMASLWMADTIAAHELDLREWLVLDFIRRQSFGAGRCEAYIPRLDLFARAVQISRGNISEILKRLKHCMVIEERPQWVYGFKLPVTDWKLPIRLDQVEVIKQLALFDGPDHIRDAMRQNFVEQCLLKPGAVSRAYPSARPSIRQGDASDPSVPESGTEAFSTSRSRFGNGQQTPMPTGPPSIVPESGTPHAYMQQCSNAQEGVLTHAPDIAACVPESGTARIKTVPLTPEQQMLFDQLGQVGAYGTQRNDQSRACWFGMVRARPRIVQELLGELKYAMETRAVELRPKNPGAWMMNKWQHWGKPDK